MIPTPVTETPPSSARSRPAVPAIHGPALRFVSAARKGVEQGREGSERPAATGTNSLEPGGSKPHRPTP